MTDRRFEFRFTPPYRLAGLPFGVTPARCELRVGDSRLLARFGPWRVETALDNIADVSITGPYSFPKTAGPAQLSLADRGLTLASNGNEASASSCVNPFAVLILSACFGIPI